MTGGHGEGLVQGILEVLGPFAGASFKVYSSSKQRPSENYNKREIRPFPEAPAALKSPLE